MIGYEAALLWCREYVCTYTLNDYIFAEQVTQNFQTIYGDSEKSIVVTELYTKSTTNSDCNLWQTSPESRPNAIELKQNQSK